MVIHVVFSNFAPKLKHMAKNQVWHDDFWLPLLQLYLKKPVGTKPLYSKDLVDLSLELHIAPQALQARMHQIERLETPLIERLWQTYSENPRRLQRAVNTLRQMKDFGASDAFYRGVEIQESFEKDFRPLAENKRLKPVMLILVLNLFFQLTPATMVEETPEVVELARQMKLSPAEVVEVLVTFQSCDPYFTKSDVTPSPLLPACQQIWHRYGNGDPNQLNELAQELMAYFK